MIIAEKLTFELHALMINYCRKQLAELKEVTIKEWKYKGRTAEFCCLGGKRYLAAGATGRELLPIGRERDLITKELNLLLAAWHSKYGDALVPDLNPHPVKRIVWESMTMDRKYFELVPAEMNDYKSSPELSYKGVNYKSKSERAIAMVYDELGIEFKYETPIYLGGIKYTPDFLGYSKLTGRCFYHEHQGKMGDQKYRDDKARSQRVYKDLGLIEGLDIIYTHEGGGIVFNPENTKYELTALIMRNLDLAAEQTP